MANFGQGLFGVLEEAEAQQAQEDQELDEVLEEGFGEEQDLTGIEDMRARAATEVQKAGGPVRRAPVPGVDPMSAFFKGGGGGSGGMLGGMVRGKLAGGGGGGPSRAMFGSPGKAAGAGAAKGAAKGMMKGMGVGGPVGAVIGRAILGYLGAKFKGSSAVTGPMVSAGEASSAGEGLLQRQLQKVAKRQAKDAERGKDKKADLKEKDLSEASLDDDKKDMSELGGLEKDPEFWSHLGSMFLGGL